MDGVYEGNFTLDKSGTASSPIYILPKTKGKAIIDPGKNRTGETGITVNASNVWLIDLHVTSSSTEKREDLGNSVPYEAGISVFGNNVKLINCWIYDIPGGGLQLWRPGLNLEVYGCVIFNNGSQATTRGTGHGMYVQHDDPDFPKVLRNNVVFNNASQGINIYTTNPPNGGVISHENTAFNTGSIANFNSFVHRPPHNFTIGSENNLSYSMQVFDNIFYSDLQGGRLTSDRLRNVTLGREYKPNRDFRFYDNLIYGGGNQLEIQPLETLRLFGNKFYNVHGKFFQFLVLPDALPDVVWNENQYFQTSSDGAPFTSTDFTTWKSASGFDLNSSLNLALPTQPEIRVIRNRYDQNRFYVTILNFSKQPEISVDFSGFGINSSAEFEAIDLQNPFDELTKIAGDLATGKISFPMTNQVALAPKGNMPHQPVHTDETFAVFQVQFRELLSIPEFKDTAQVYLDENGVGRISPSILLSNQPSDDFTYDYSIGPEVNCTNLGFSDLIVTATQVQGSTVVKDTIKLSVLDTIPPRFDAADAYVIFDPTIGKAEYSIGDFDVVLPEDNCDRYFRVDIDGPEITCALLGTNWDSYQKFPVKIIVADQSGNESIRNVYVHISNIQESKKVSISSLKPLDESGSILRLGNEMEYQILAWFKDGELIPNQKGKELNISTPGRYHARLLLSTGCEVSSRDFYFETNFPPRIETVDLSLDEAGKATLGLLDIFENEPFEPGFWSLSISEFSCADLGQEVVKVSYKPELIPTSPQISSMIEFWVKVNIKDELAPTANFKDVSYPFDLTLGELSFNPQDFIAGLPEDNCASESVSVTLSKSSVTCADVDSERVNYPIDLDVILTDASGNRTVYTTFALLNLFESKKVSLRQSGILFSGNTVELILGDELEFEVVEWRKDLGTIPGEKGKVLSVDQPGVYAAVLQLKNGCTVSSQVLEVIEREEGFPEVKSIVEINLNENGIALLKPEDCFEKWPLDGDYEISLSKREFSCENLGANQIILTLQDAQGLSNEFQVQIQIKDLLPPILSTRIPSLNFDLLKGELTLNPEDFVESLTDNCSIQSLQLNKSKITCEDYDLLQEVILTATDQSGNSVSKALTFSVNPIESQKISISPESGASYTEGQVVEIRLGEEFDFVVLGWYRNGELLAGQKGKAIAVEKAGTYWAELIPEGGGCLVESKKTEIQFNALPFGEIKESVSLVLGSEGKADLKPYDVFVSWPLSDPNLTVTLQQSGFTCADLGEKIIGIVIKNPSGQTWDRSIQVNVKDTTAPVLKPKNLNLELGVTKGTVSLNPDMVLESATDNCGIKEVTLDRQSFSCEDLGKTFTIKIRAVDQSENVAEAVTTVTVQRVENLPVLLQGVEEICSGEEAMLELSSEASFEVIRWRRNGVEIPDQTGKTLSTQEPGNYHAVIRYSGGCISESNTFEVKVNPLPEGEIEVDGNILRAPEGNYTYQWFRNGQVISSATSRTLTVDQMGEYEVELTSSSGCSARLEPVTLTISSIGVPLARKALELKIYPNPAREKVRLGLEGDILENQEMEIRVFDQNGKDMSRLVQSFFLDSQSIDLYLNDLAPGTYLVWVLGSRQQSFFGKLVIQ
ncbi:hypothetical protein GCM10027164_35850 [Algoriphagus taiwanensis]